MSTIDTEDIVCADVTTARAMINTDIKRPSMVTHIPMEIVDYLGIKGGQSIQWLLLRDGTLRIIVKK